MYHCGFLDVTLKVLRSVCFHCSRLRFDKKDMKYKRALQIKNPKVGQQSWMETSGAQREGPFWVQGSTTVYVRGNR